MALSVIYYIKTVSAFRRLANTEYHVHPTTHQRAQQEEADEIHEAEMAYAPKPARARYVLG